MYPRARGRETPSLSLEGFGAQRRMRGPRRRDGEAPFTHKNTDNAFAE